MEVEVEIKEKEKVKEEMVIKKKVMIIGKNKKI